MDGMKPTYHLPPNFSIPPPPDGPFHLGTVVQSFDNKAKMRPLNHDDDRLAIPEKEIYRSQKGGLTATRSKLKTGVLGIWAQFMGIEGIGGEISHSTERSENDVYSLQSEETQYFYPRPSYISRSIELPDVQDYLLGHNYGAPVYLITGLKIAKGASVNNKGWKKMETKAEIGLNNPGGTNLKVGPKGGTSTETNTSLSFTESSDIVVGIQCLKVYHKKGFLGTTKELVNEPYTKGATMVDADTGPFAPETFSNYVVKDLDEKDMESKVALTQDDNDGQQSIWIVPAGDSQN